MAQRALVALGLLFICIIIAMFLKPTYENFYMGTTCPVNQKLVNGECKPCESGSYSAGGTATTCTVCAAGMNLNNGVCSACPPGKFSGNNGQTLCNNCGKGTYSETPGASLCLSCAAGKYQDAEGQPSCKKCPSGMYQSSVGKDKCEECPAGKFSENEGSAYCLSCGPGEYQDKKGQSECVKCPKDSYSDKTSAIGCTKCPEGYFTDEQGATTLSDCVKALKTSDCVDIYKTARYEFDSLTKPTGKSLYFNLTADNFNILGSNDTIKPTDSMQSNISKCVINQRLKDRSDICKKNSAIKADSCGSAVGTDSKSLLQAFEYVNSKGICVDKSGGTIPYPTIRPQGTKGTAENVLAHIVKCTDPQNSKTCTYNYPLDGVTHTTNPCTDRNMIYDFDKEECTDPSVNTVDPKSNNCNTNQVFDPVTGKCLNVVTPIKAMPPNTKGKLVEGDYRDCKTINMGDCTVVYKKKATEDTEIADTVNPCPTVFNPSNTIYNFDTYSCEKPSTQGFVNYSNENYRLETPIIA